MRTILVCLIAISFLGCAGLKQLNPIPGISVGGDNESTGRVTASISVDLCQLGDVWKIGGLIKAGLELAGMDCDVAVWDEVTDLPAPDPIGPTPVPPFENPDTLGS